MLTLRLLGGFGLHEESGASIARLSQRRAEAALARLALCGELGCTRDRLANLLWPESDAEHARHNLRSALQAVRIAADQDIIIFSGELRSARHAQELAPACPGRKCPHT